MFVESLISIKSQAEQSLAREVDCSVLSVPDYLDDFDRDAVAAAAFDLGFESVQIIRSSEAIRLAYDFGECGGRHFEKDCDLNKPFITLVVDSTPRSLSLMTVSMGKYEATVLNHLESYDWGEDGVDSSAVNDKNPESAYDHHLQKKLGAMLLEITVPNGSTRKVESQSIASVQDISAVVLVGNVPSASHGLISNTLAKSLEEELGAQESWFFDIIDPSQVVSIGAARRAKALVDSAASAHQQQTAGGEHEEL